MSAELDRYRDEVRDWLAGHIPGWWRERPAATIFEAEDEFDALRDWHRTVYDAGYVGVTWPAEFGGRALSPAHDIVRAEEFERGGAPPTVNSLGLSLCGPALLEFGTDAQKRRYLRSMLSAEEVWCQGYSEPGSGSDLASLQTRAARDGDAYVVNGQKIWTSNGRQADWMFCLVRTDTEAPKHGGIGFLLIDMHAPGIEVAPLVQMTGGSDFCQVFFTDVRVPAENMVGEPTQGWQIANAVLMHERGADPGVLRYERFLAELAARARSARARGRPLAADPVFRQRYAGLAIEFEALRRSTLQALEAAKAGVAPGPESSLFKLRASELEQRLATLAVDAQGPRGQLWQDEPRAVDTGIWQFRELWSRAYTIYAGTSEIQRNILAERVLGLPRR